MTSSSIDIDAACDFVWHEARLLDRRRLALLRGDEAAAAAVNAALRAYQNPDGGFGNALEPDLRTPLSQPQPAEFALRVLDETGELPADVIEALCDWLGTVTTRQGGVPFVLPSAMRHPHAPWWAAPEDPDADLNPTAAIVGMLLKHEVAHGWLGPAVDFCWRTIEAGEQPDEVHAFVAAFTFLEYVPDRPRAERAAERLGQRLVAEGHVTLDPEAEGYVHGPLQVAEGPDALAAGVFAPAAIEAAVDGLAAKQLPDGGWPITWSPPSDAAVCEWRGAVTVDALRRLVTWGRVDPDAVGAP